MNKNFFASLFDFKFESYITKQVASVVYAILTIVIVVVAAIAELVWLLTFVSSLQDIGYSYFDWTPLFGIILLPPLTFLSIVALRLSFETSIALVDIAQNTKK